MRLLHLSVLGTLILFLSLCTVVVAREAFITLPDKTDDETFEANEISTINELAVTTKRIIIDDFEDGNFTNRLDGECGAWDLDPNREYTDCQPSIIDYAAPALSRKVLQLTYDIDSPYRAKNGYWMKLNDVDARTYDHLEFLVKGDTIRPFTTTFKIEIKKYKDEERVDQLVGSYIVTNITSSWQRVSIPLYKFNAIAEWNNLNELVIIFDNRLCDQREGILYFDMFQFKNNGYQGPSAYDFRGSAIQKTTGEYNPVEWAQWLAERLEGYPDQLFVHKEFPTNDQEFLLEIARDTWRFFDEIIDKKTHLPLDRIEFSDQGIFGEGCSVGDYTNVTNIGLYLICLIAGYDFGFIDEAETLRRIHNTLNTIESLETYQHFLFNYYDTTTLERTSNFLSLIDCGWLTAGITIVKNTFRDAPELVQRCAALLDKWNFAFFYDDVEQQFFHGYFDNIKAYANYHYGTFYTEARIVSYLAVAKGDVPLEHWLALHRTLPEDYTWQQQEPKNRSIKKFRDIAYPGGYYDAQGKKYVPSWGGSLFESLMPTLLLKEKELAPQSLGLNNQHHSEIHVNYALETLGYSIWGMSPSSVPTGGYSEFGVEPLGLRGYKEGVITPHVTFLALEYVPEAAIKNLRTFINNYTLYGEYGFYDAVDPVTKKVALKYLCLNQAMIFIALDNYLNNGIMRERFHTEPIIKKGEYLLTEENLFA